MPSNKSTIMPTSIYNPIQQVPVFGVWQAHPQRVRDENKLTIVLLSDDGVNAPNMPKTLTSSITEQIVAMLKSADSSYEPSFVMNEELTLARDAKRGKKQDDEGRWSWFYNYSKPIPVIVGAGELEW